MEDRWPTDIDLLSYPSIIKGARWGTPPALRPFFTKHVGFMYSEAMQAI